MSDKELGALVGVALGDALGAPHECLRTNVTREEYTGRLEHEIKIFNRFKKETTAYPVGSITDDTEMTLALLRSIKNRTYSRELALPEYLAFANSCPHLGKNTRALMKGVTTARGFTARYNKVSNWESRQSNGTLMRAMPLALLNDYETCLAEDCNLTNNNPVNRSCSQWYVGNMRNLLYEEDNALPAIDTSSACVSGKAKGHVIVPIMLCERYLDCSSSYREGIDCVVRLGGDTDTNAAIVGGLLGAKFGYRAMMEDEITRGNIEILQQANPDLHFLEFLEMAL